MRCRSGSIGWCRRNVVRVSDFEQTLREVRKLGVELEPHACGHEAERFDQTLHVRIGHLARLKSQTPRDLWVRLRELACEHVQLASMTEGTHQIAKRARIADQLDMQVRQAFPSFVIPQQKC